MRPVPAGLQASEAPETLHPQPLGARAQPQALAVQERRGDGLYAPFPSSQAGLLWETPPLPQEAPALRLPHSQPVMDAAVSLCGGPRPVSCAGPSAGPGGAEPLGPEPTAHPHPWRLLPASATAARPSSSGPGRLRGWGRGGGGWEAPHSPSSAPRPPAVPASDLDLLGPPEGARWAAREDPRVTAGSRPGVPSLPFPSRPPPVAGPSAPDPAPDPSLQEQHGLRVKMLLLGRALLYSAGWPPEKQAQRLGLR